jgi:spore germination cell wall hydrolase CwlJ-like protein
MRRRRGHGYARRRMRQPRTAGSRSLFSGILCAGILAVGIWTVTKWTGRKVPPLKPTMDEARAINADIPFVEGPVLPAKPYRFVGSSRTRSNSAECLATAALYEAGSDDRGQKAVIQVVINRLRARGFPKTICGVVYQGHSRATGCQFSFACDHSLLRRPEQRGWARARHNARIALDGYVFGKIGTSTHYHTDWVVPYWSASLDKIAKVRSHIFYRPPRPDPGQ